MSSTSNTITTCSITCSTTTTTITTPVDLITRITHMETLSTNSQ